jgi:hypothetical protein
MTGTDVDMAVCQCCGQKRPCPTKEGLWEYLDHPIFNPDGTLYDYSRWVKVNIIDAGKFGKADESCKDDHSVSLLLVPVGMKRAMDWPERAVWRKIGDVPEIDPGEVIVEGTRLRDGEWMGKWDDESEAAKRRIFIEGR